MPLRNVAIAALIAAAAMLARPAAGREMHPHPAAGAHLTHEESAARHAGQQPPALKTPPLPDTMTLDDVLNRAAEPPPPHYPRTLADDRLYVYTLVEQLEYRIADADTRDRLGWDAQGWIGSDYNKFWWKCEGEAVFQGHDEGESETDLLYSRLIAPFWSAQIGARYANEWTTGDYDDHWYGVVALQGLAPYMFELDNSLYISDGGDVTFELTAEYDLRFTQRLVLQPRAELGFAAQDIHERDMGAGMTDATLGLRLRYEMRREFAPYIGIRYRTLVGKTHNIAESGGRDTEQFYFVAGLRFAF